MSGYEGDSAHDRRGSAWRTIMLVVMAIATVVVLAALVITVGEANRQRDRALDAQRHSYDVMILVRTLQGTIARSEASLGRYVISGDQALGQLYFDDWRRASDSMERLAKLTNDNEGQARRMRELRAAFQLRGNELALTALNTNYRKNSQALARYYRARNGGSLRAINAALDGIIADERHLLERRTSRAMTAVHRSTVAATVLAVFGLLLVIGVIMLGWIVVRARGEIAAERERADELSMAVATATAELRVQEARLRQAQKMDAVGQLTGGIAHDFNNMLSVILGGIELAQRNLAGGRDIARHLDNAKDGAVRAAALTRQLLAFARETAMNPEPVDAERLFADVAELLDRTLGDGVTLRLRDESDAWCARVDRVQLENTILNLAVNARDAMDGRGTLTIAAGRTTLSEAADGCPAGDYLSLRVSDTGCGMPPEVLERAFEPFFTTKPVGHGTGLGLAQVFSFARQNGGDVRIASTPGAGTSVTLLLPRERVAAALAPGQTPFAPVAVTEPAAPALAILVVEDDPRVLAATMGALQELGHRPVACNDPLEAETALARMGMPDLILSDVLMPTRTGPEMVAALGAAAARIPVLFVTGFAGDMGREIDLGGHPVLRKPFTLAGLAHAIAAATGGGRAPDEQLAAE